MLSIQTCIAQWLDPLQDQEPIPQFTIQKQTQEGWQRIGSIAGDSIIPVGRGRWAVLYQGKWALVTETGRYLTLAQYESMTRLNGPVLLASVTASIQLLLDLDGKPVLPDTLSNVQVDGNWALVAGHREVSSKRRKYHLAHLPSKRIIFDEVQHYSTRGGLVLATSKKNNPAIFNLDGDTLLSPGQAAWDVQLSDSNSLAIRFASGWQAYCLDKGKLKPRSAQVWDSMTVLPNGHFLVVKNESAYMMDAAMHPMAGGTGHCFALMPNGLVKHDSPDGVWYWRQDGCRLQIPNLEIAFSQDTIVVARNGVQWQFFGKDGYPISYAIGLQAGGFTRIGRFNAGLAITQLHGKYGFTGPEGLKRLGHRYDSVRLFSEGRAAVYLSLNERITGWGFVTNKDSLVTQPVYQWTEDFCHGMAATKRNGRYNVLTTSGQELFKSGLDSCQRLPSLGILVWQQGLVGWVGPAAQQRMLPQFLSIQPHNNLLATFRNRSGRMGLWASLPELKLEPVFKQLAYNHWDSSLASLRQ